MDKKKYCKILLLFVFLGCASRNDVVYFTQGEINQNRVNNDYKLRFKPDDMLQIIVSGKDLESVQAFNLPVFAVQNTKQVIGQPQLQAYLVDSDGFIEFPILGRIQIAGLSRVEVIELLKKKLDPIYIKNPIINIYITNFKITVEGDVMRPGTYTSQNERLSILDALGLAGGMNITGNRENVIIIREERNSKKEYRINLKSKEIFSSPAYYLQQNDVIYVEPNYARVQDAAYTRNTGLFISLASVFISLLTIITR